MAQTVNPTASIIFNQGTYRPELVLAENVVLKVGTAIAGPYLKPQRASQLSAVLGFQHGPLVRSSAHHTARGGALLMVRSRASVPGTTGSVTKLPAASSLGSLALSLQTYTLHAQAASGAALNLNSGWTAPPAPLPVKITSGVGTVAHTQTFTYRDEEGAVKTAAVSIGAAGTVTTTFEASQILAVTSNVDPQGTQDYTANFAGPNDRYQLRIKIVQGGQVGVSNAVTPRWQLSLDDGRTYSRTYTLGSGGTAELLTYAGGLVQQPTGLLATFSTSSLTTTFYGNIRVAGATTPGDIVYTAKVASVTVTHAVGAGDAARAVAVVGTAITVTPARTAGVVDASETALAITTYIMTSADAGPVAARAIVNASPVGTGLGLLAAAASAGTTNGNLTFTALQEDVQVRILPTPSASAASITFAFSGTNNRYVTIYTVTDANSISTSTAAQVVAAIAANATAAALLSATASGTGASLAGTLGTWAALAVAFATGDVFTASTTPPRWNDADLQEVFAALLANNTALTNFGFLHLIGDASQNTLTLADGFVTNMRNSYRQFKHGWIEGTFMVPGTVEATWRSALIAAYTTASDFVGIGAGETLVNNEAYGTVDMMNATTPIVARTAICPISELPSHVDCQTNMGTRFALEDCIPRSADGSTPPLFQSEDSLITLHEAGFSTLRTHANRVGIYVRQAMMFSITGSPYTFVTQRRVADVAAAIAYDTIVRRLNDNLLTDPRTGDLASIERDNLSKEVEAAVRTRLMGGPRQHVSAVACLIDENPDYTQNGRITGTVVIVGRTPATTITLAIAYAPRI